MKLRMTVDGLTNTDRTLTDEGQAAASALIMSYLHCPGPDIEEGGEMILELDTDAGTILVIKPDAG